jgi:MoxR-like ATPase
MAMTAAGFRSRFDHLTARLQLSVVGKPIQVRRALTCLLAGGHLLLDDVPGVGKTTLATALAGTVTGGTTTRIQGTPDLLPTDILGTPIYDQTTRTYAFRAGPVVANIVLFDEINRCAPRTQAALLQAMQEHQVTSFGHEVHLPEPFMVIGTQNPQETLGTYPLPEAQLDRFLMRLSLGYPGRSDEERMIKMQAQRTWARSEEPHHGQGLPVDEIREMAELAADVYVADSVYGYLLDIVTATRCGRGDDAIAPEILLGASPRASVDLLRAAKVHALVGRADQAPGRPYLRPDDVAEIATDVLAHRLVLAATGARSVSDSQRAAVDRVIATVPRPQQVSAAGRR